MSKYVEVKLPNGVVVTGFEFEINGSSFIVDKAKRLHFVDPSLSRAEVEGNPTIPGDVRAYVTSLLAKSPSTSLVDKMISERQTGVCTKDKVPKYAMIVMTELRRHFGGDANFDGTSIRVAGEVLDAPYTPDSLRAAGAGKDAGGAVHIKKILTRIWQNIPCEIDANGQVHDRRRPAAVEAPADPPAVFLTPTSEGPAPGSGESGEDATAAGAAAPPVAKNSNRSKASRGRKGR